MTQETPPKPAEQDSMVLRTVYFPVELDEELKKFAFHRSTSKGDLIRKAVRTLMAELRQAEEAHSEEGATGADPAPGAPTPPDDQA
jgi:hypothetical protein